MIHPMAKYQSNRTNGLETMIILPHRPFTGEPIALDYTTSSTMVLNFSNSKLFPIENYSKSIKYTVTKWTVLVLTIIELLASIYFAIYSTHGNTINDTVLIAICVLINDLIEIMLIAGAMCANYCLTLSYVLVMTICIVLSIAIVTLYDMFLWTVLFVYIGKISKLLLALLLARMIRNSNGNKYDDY